MARSSTLLLAAVACALLGTALAQDNSCSSQGLQGSCNACVCCCYASEAGFVNYEPTDDCTCKRYVNSSQVSTTVVISVMVGFVAVLSSLYFSGSLCRVTPYKREERLYFTVRPPLSAVHQAPVYSQ